MEFQRPHFILLIIILLTSSPSSSSAQSLSSFSTSNSPWNPSQNRTLLSRNTAFAAGFRRLPASSNLFVFSIWYSNTSDQTIIWSANWDSPVRAAASLIITSNDDLQLINGSSGPIIWNTTTTANSSSTRLILRDDGNLVFGSWQSFDHPTDTFLPNQTFGNDTVLVSRNGKFSFNGLGNLLFNGSDSYWSLGNGIVSFGVDGQVQKDGGGPLILADYGQNRTRRLTMGDDGNLRFFSYNPVTNTWVPVWVAVLEVCLVHGLCGPGYICYSNGSTLSGYQCLCPPGFRQSAGSDSCERKIPIVDMGRSKFLRLDYVNYSGGSNQTSLNLFNLDHCESRCRNNRRCLGFGFRFNGLGYCVLQLDNIMNGYWSPGTEMAFYLRVDNSELDPSNFTGMSEVLDTTCPIQYSLPDPSEESNGTTRNIIIITILFGVEIAGGVFLFRAFLKRYVKYRDMAQTLGLGLLPTAGPRRFSYAEIKSATNDFSVENIIGKGGFSDVYIGKLHDGRPVAVKCLKNVTGGDAEFWGEVTIIARMHHLNLVRLWGFCNEKGRRVLVYEHVPNGSLDKYLFMSGHVVPDIRDDNTNEIELMPGSNQKPILDWNIRYRIALGVARAIAYLHEECLEWVLHCDIKPENILLGDDFCPKVADFGLSKLKKKEQMVTKSRIRGTRGYLAPEWIKNDSITSKVDVFSFGMVLLEIVTGVRNLLQGPSTSIPSDEWYLPQWAYEMAIEEPRFEEILDRRIIHSYDNKTHFKLIERMVKTAMWCVQERPENRPSMGKVAKMLEGTVEIMEPPKPTIFFIGGDN
ncbi:hypothetical protein SOVF_094500 [Spinacia oleracea]|uniref:Receptor-like serine/threonine-protein kinase n=1 Tax=Spinacia oleracea TaxID=3562 RepID=A0A9R0IJ32_SPIOL|nr:G-type lectin S-receptor-like serine/threonine-protein kinase At2g19130 [Spinacia oleracea]KNA15845.1 hypothetical protein SOVF_094500 [Spinacia oleracea]